MTARFSRALPFGANLIGRDRTQFRLYAPAQRAVAVAIEGRAHLPMTDRGDGWFEATAECGAGTRYRYRLGSGVSVPDPASRAQAGDVHDASLVVDPAAYEWRHPEWRGRPWHETVLYELHAGLLGGFRGVMRELPRLAELGVTAVELMPVNDFPGARNWGYDGVLPYAPDASYGSPGDLKALIDAAHEHGLMIFLDVVYNHFGPDGNYLPSYAPAMFRDDVATPWGPAIDFRRPDVRRFFTENALYWLIDYRFDGLRFDAVHAISESDWLDEMAAEIRAQVEPGRQVHLVLEHDGNVASLLDHAFDAQWNDDAHHVLHVLLTGEREGYYEDYADDPAERLARCLAEGFAYQGEPSRASGGPRGTASADLPPTAFVLFLQNHDQIGNRAFGERLTALSPPAALEAAIALQILAPQIPLLFMGEEDASRTPFLFFADYKGELADAVREGRRKEFAGFAAFADPVKRAQIPDPNAPGTFRASMPRPDPDAAQARRDVLQRSCSRCAGPRSCRALQAGARAIGATVLGEAAVMARWRMGDGANHVIATNLGSVRVPLAPPGGRLWAWLRARPGRGRAGSWSRLSRRKQRVAFWSNARAMSDAAVRDLAGRARHPGRLAGCCRPRPNGQVAAPTVLAAKAFRSEARCACRATPTPRRAGQCFAERPPTAPSNETARCRRRGGALLRARGRAAACVAGVAAQLYGLRRAGDCGIGDFAAVAALAESAARQGADAVALSPAHALFAADTSRYGPYSPSSRLFLNPLYADADATDSLCCRTMPATWSMRRLIDWPKIGVPAKIFRRAATDALRREVPRRAPQDLMFRGIGRSLGAARAALRRGRLRRAFPQAAGAAGISPRSANGRASSAWHDPRSSAAEATARAHRDRRRERSHRRILQ